MDGEILVKMIPQKMDGEIQTMTHSVGPLIPQFPPVPICFWKVLGLVFGLVPERVVEEHSHGFHEIVPNPPTTFGWWFQVLF